MTSRADKIDIDEVVEGYYTSSNDCHYIQLTPFVSEQINPQTLQHSFDGVNWHSEEEIKEAIDAWEVLFATKNAV